MESYPQQYFDGMGETAAVCGEASPFVQTDAVVGQDQDLMPFVRLLCTT